MGKLRILSIDGGGLRGIIPVKMLQHIESLTGVPAFDMFDMVVGTSTGGLITCALTASEDGRRPKYTTTDIEQLYVNNGKIIFPKANAIDNLAAFFKPKFSPDGLQSVLTKYLGDLTISNCLKPIYVPSYDILNNEPVYFRSSSIKKDPTTNAKLVDVCRATSAAPTYFRAYQFAFGGKQRVCVDGGVFMNNPVVGVLAEVLNSSVYYNNYDKSKFPDEIYVLSLGTGHYTSDLAKKKFEDGGELNWASEISDVMMQGVNTATCSEATEFLNDGSFLRLTIPIDNPDYDDLADSSDDTRNYLVGKVAELWNNEDTKKSLDSFIENAGLKSLQTIRKFIDIDDISTTLHNTHTNTSSN